MSGSSAQKQSQNEKKKNKADQNVLTETQNDTQKTGLCPNCNAELPDLAIFCPECGSSTGHLCPKCGAPASATADICQSCGAWLLEGQCKFCYAEIPDEALFCPECGKPKDSIPCPHCGKLSIFDFCSNCGKPVTEEAVAEIQNQITQEITTTEAENKTFNSNQEARRYYNASAIALKTGIEAELAKLEALLNDDQFINNEPEPEQIKVELPPVRKSLFSDKQLESIRKTGAAVDEVTKQRIEEERIAEEKRKEEERIAEEKRKAEEAERKRREAERKRQEEERQRQIKEAQARKEELERRLRNRSWRCYAYGVVHPGGPNECADPSRGGHYV